MIKPDNSPKLVGVLVALLATPLLPGQAQQSDPVATDSGAPAQTAKPAPSAQTAEDARLITLRKKAAEAHEGGL